VARTEKPLRGAEARLPHPVAGSTGHGPAATPPPPESKVGAGGQPPKTSEKEVSRLFEPQTPPPPQTREDHPGAAALGGAPGQRPGSSTKLGQASGARDRYDIEDIADPVEREAARRLQQIIQRIKSNRDRRPVPAGKVTGNASEEDWRRDW
jgi:hypothetical protein